MTVPVTVMMLILSGIFTQIHSLKYKRMDAAVNKYSLDKMFENVQKFLSSNGEFVPDVNYPLA
jgi:hypothetical protein